MPRAFFISEAAGNSSQANLETFSKVNELIGLARGLNRELKAAALLSIAPTNPAIREVEDARELIAEFDQLELADTIIRDALLVGQGASNSTTAKHVQRSSFWRRNSSNSTDWMRYVQQTQNSTTHRCNCRHRQQH